MPEATITMTMLGGEITGPSESTSENIAELKTPPDGEFDTSFRERLALFADVATVRSNIWPLLMHMSLHEADLRPKLQLDLTMTEDSIEAPPRRSLLPKPSRAFTNTSAADSEPWITVDTLGSVPTSLGEEDEEAAVVGTCMKLLEEADEICLQHPSLLAVRLLCRRRRTVPSC